ncbi:hypothetical protein BO70DRAFT_362024 [Aspergillus heteromorphus CBS 117.55]|uniref:Serine hydrolase domain-containing protein n=1 Tax=Aspergillus heteromorphus CBS 117.55 TaxID=1448321 RepID=A0A317W6R5_9EURO|nr:uncharacterized protein BO70DRAFT_362024 [Aspergillus heteromorphus CBS 117.55]PWY82063.1 hypothetical protein BO70DRAFT_362024 [Aspergillus heteromorphus CBS 117.55]
MPQDDPSLVLQALRDLDKFIEVEGPFDGIIAFSMGALLTTTYLIQHGIKKPHTPLPFQCGIFLSGQVPVDPIALERGEIRVLDPAVDGDQLMANFPTAHIWDPNDEAYRDQSERLSGLCDPRVQLRLHHGEGHAVPGPRAQDSLLGSVRVIRRTVEQAAMMV